MTNTNDRINCLAQKKLFISCIVPLHNEQGNVLRFFPALRNEIAQYTDQFEIIAIDDGSTDQTRIALSQLYQTIPELKTIFLSRRFGKEKAISAGIDYVKGDVTLIIDGDFQHPFSTIKEFLRRWAEGYDMVYGIRHDRKQEGWFKKTCTGLFYKFTQFFTEVPIPKNAGDFRLLDKRVVEALRACPENNRFMKGLYAWVGFDSVGVEFEVQARQAGKTSWSFKRLFSLALHGIFSFSDVPLRFWSLLGFTISSISFIYALWIILDTLLFGVDLPGFATIVVAIVFFGGIQLLSIGILGEYIGRIFTEVKQRPRYLIAKKHGFDD
ncbi:glycosyltransferase family 2 protein [Coxiella burnetii]|uniref:Polyprenyl-phosphate beta-D-glucosyltransferase n=2 Tax=Coxiella burnetii TaxID=777 RepID=Q83DW4_COXBU|nr:glycosyltransferase family 2 protein [Coxiella burnetii]NP_819608.1 polyprenyl-phosphate beta-D-glucosyltransferase [Coxiella burnetii RSA 493]AAO90122.1 polyprenyl-phosphate beta-D-glucosyltransferase [Coxiella burnetii RSA 493]ABX78515.1 glycosyl transferase, group 2 family protein [Coxiella burnetii RSA 331]ACJ18722.1 polyprenyl-phosphate beta-D-glucosyltransferase [Coxiella burnetii CbuG_Q212]ACJ20444.1 polyprenyl-phosphate beta-D-glucosyltransferase [Coxiella burnetii CbuK_Q154]AIT635